MPDDPNPPRCFTSRDAPAGGVGGERVAVVGYGNLGRPLALNLRDSGAAHVQVGNVDDDYAERARADGFTVLPIAEATAGADIVMVLLSDEVIPEVFASDIGPHLAPGAATVFASGYTLAYGLIEPPVDTDVLLLAPRMAGENARQRFLDGEGFVAYVSVERDASGRAWDRLLGLADGVGVLRAGALELSARLEADLDLLVEQTVGAALGVAIMTAFQLGTETGIPPEALVMEMYMSGEMEMVFRSFRTEGFYRASSVHGPTALYGGFLRTLELLQSELPGLFRQTLETIRSGRFAEQFQAEREAGYPMLSQATAMSMDDSPQAQAEARVRALLADR